MPKILFSFSKDEVWELAELGVVWDREEGI